MFCHLSQSFLDKALFFFFFSKPKEATLSFWPRNFQKIFFVFWTKLLMIAVGKCLKNRWVSLQKKQIANYLIQKYSLTYIFSFFFILRLFVTSLTVLVSAEETKVVFHPKAYSAWAFGGFKFFSNVYSN